MMTLELLRELMQHMEWADAVVWSAVVADPRATEDRAVLDRLGHLHTVQHAFLQVWRDEPLQFPEPAALAAPDDLRAWAREFYPQATIFLDTLDVQKLSASVVMPWADRLTAAVTGGPATGIPTLAETILQITAHSTYHRGQINARLRELGIEPPLTDFIAWIWFGRPEPDWPSATLRPA